MVYTHQIKCNTSTYMRWGPTGPCERTIHILKILLNLFLLYVFNLRVKTSHMRSRSNAVLSNPEYYECVGFTRESPLCSEPGDRISSVTTLISETSNKYGLLSSFILHPVTTWCPRQDRGLTTSPQTNIKVSGGRPSEPSATQVGHTHCVRQKVCYPGIYSLGTCAPLYVWRPHWPFKIYQNSQFISLCVNRLMSWECRERAGQQDRAGAIVSPQAVLGLQEFIHRFMNSFIPHQ